MYSNSREAEKSEIEELRKINQELYKMVEQTIVSKCEWIRKWIEADNELIALKEATNEDSCKNSDMPKVECAILQ